MKTEHKTLIILLLIVILGSLFRFSGLFTIPPGLYPDEAMNGNNALEAISTGNYKIFYPENNGREGMFINIQAFFLHFFLNFYPTPEPWMLRFTSTLFGICTVLGIYFLTKELFRKNERAKTFALISTFFIATSFWHINFSRIGFRAIMAPAFLTWGIYFLLLSFRKIEENSQLLISNFQNLKYKILFPVFAGMVYGLGMHSYIAYRATPLLILFFFFLIAFKSNRKQAVRFGSLFVLGSIIISIPLIIYFAQNPQDFLGRTSQVSIFSGESPLKDLGLNVTKTIGMFFVYGDSNWRHNLSGTPELFWPIAIFFAIGIIAGITTILKKKKEEEKSRWFKNSAFGFWILFSWLSVTALPVVVSNEGIPHALRSILMIPPAMILAGVGSVFMYDWIKNKNVPKTLLNISAGLLLGFIGVYTFYTYFIIWGPHQETANAFSSDSVEIGHMLNSLPKEINKYIVTNGSGTLVRGIPMPSQTVMYITDSFTSKKQEEKNIFYILPEEKNTIPQGGFVVELK
ncbi:MAG: hypothetical protein AB1333_02190 [Patescibacteria group bacterium]